MGLLNFIKKLQEPKIIDVNCIPVKSIMRLHGEIQILRERYGDLEEIGCVLYDKHTEKMWTNIPQCEWGVENGKLYFKILVNPNYQIKTTKLKKKNERTTRK